MHIHLPWLLAALTIIICSVLAVVAPTEQQKLERTDLRKQYRDKNKLN